MRIYDRIIQVCKQIIQGMRKMLNSQSKPITTKIEIILEGRALEDFQKIKELDHISSEDAIKKALSNQLYLSRKKDQGSQIFVQDNERKIKRVNFH